MMLIRQARLPLVDLGGLPAVALYAGNEFTCAILVPLTSIMFQRSVLEQEGCGAGWGEACDIGGRKI